MTLNQTLPLEALELTVGQRLRLRREELGVTIRDVAAITKIQASHLMYLEEDRFDELPAEVFARGFMRNYARELRLSDTELLAAYEQQTGRAAAPRVELAPVAVPRSVEHHWFTQRGNLGRIAYGGALAAFIIGLAVSVLVFGGDDAVRSASYAPAPASAWQPVAPAAADWQTVREN